MLTDCTINRKFGVILLANFQTRCDKFPGIYLYLILNNFLCFGLNTSYNHNLFYYYY